MLLLLLRLRQALAALNAAAAVWAGEPGCLGVVGLGSGASEWLLCIHVHCDVSQEGTACVCVGLDGLWCNRSCRGCLCHQGWRHEELFPVRQQEGLVCPSDQAPGVMQVPFLVCVWQRLQLLGWHTGSKGG